MYWLHSCTCSRFCWRSKKTTIWKIETTGTAYARALWTRSRCSGWYIQVCSTQWIEIQIARLSFSYLKMINCFLFRAPSKKKEWDLTFLIECGYTRWCIDAWCKLREVFEIHIDALIKHFILMHRTQSNDYVECSFTTVWKSKSFCPFGFLYVIFANFKECLWYSSSAEIFNIELYFSNEKSAFRYE